jgi:hypothetical protein
MQLASAKLLLVRGTGKWQTSQHISVMCAYPPKADILGGKRHVC